MLYICIAAYTFRTDIMFMQSEYVANKLLEFLYIIQQSKVCENLNNIKLQIMHKATCLYTTIYSCMHDYVATGIANSMLLSTIVFNSRD